MRRAGSDAAGVGDEVHEGRGISREIKLQAEFIFSGVGKMAPRLLRLLLSAPLATAYLTGEDVTLCWVSRNGTRELLSTCGADFVEFVTTLPTTRTSGAKPRPPPGPPPGKKPGPPPGRKPSAKAPKAAAAEVDDAVASALAAVRDSRSSQVARAAELKAMLEEAPAPAPPQRELGELEA